MKISQGYFHNMLILLENIFRVANNLPSRVNTLKRNKLIIEQGGESRINPDL
jgi:hypothetical protein